MLCTFFINIVKQIEAMPSASPLEPFSNTKMVGLTTADDFSFNRPVLELKLSSPNDNQMTEALW